jgi:hypothetical protein
VVVASCAKRNMVRMDKNFKRRVLSWNSLMGLLSMMCFADANASLVYALRCVNSSFILLRHPARKALQRIHESLFQYVPKKSSGFQTFYDEAIACIRHIVCLFVGIDIL